MRTLGTYTVSVLTNNNISNLSTHYRDDGWPVILRRFLAILRERGFIEGDIDDASSRLEVVKLRAELEQARLRNTVHAGSGSRSPPLSPISPQRTGGTGSVSSGASPQNLQAMVQRLIAKEKQVLQLQGALDLAKAELAKHDSKAVINFPLGCCHTGTNRDFLRVCRRKMLDGNAI